MTEFAFFLGVLGQCKQTERILFWTVKENVQFSIFYASCQVGNFSIDSLCFCHKLFNFGDFVLARNAIWLEKHNKYPSEKADHRNSKHECRDMEMRLQQDCRTDRENQHQINFSSEHWQGVLKRPFWLVRLHGTIPY